MKTLNIFALSMVWAFTGLTVSAQDLTLGDAVFNAASADPDATWYDPMRHDVPVVFEGFGANAGQTRTVTYSSGGLVAGVKTIKRHMVETGIAPVTEDVWIAFDAEDNARVVKMVRAGSLVFVATATATPPLYLPSTVTEGQSWDIAGTRVTLDQVMGSRSGCRLKITYVNAAGHSHSDYLHAGEGLLRTESGDGSGWTLIPAESAQ